MGETVYKAQFFAEPMSWVSTKAWNSSLINTPRSSETRVEASSSSSSGFLWAQPSSSRRLIRTKCQDREMKWDESS